MTLDGTQTRGQIWPQRPERLDFGIGRGAWRNCSDVDHILRRVLRVNVPIVSVGAGIPATASENAVRGVRRGVARI